MIKEIYDRRSIRKFKDDTLSKLDIEEILNNGIRAPSSKNRQPWKFVVVQEKAKREMIEAFILGIEREESGFALLPNSKRFLAAAKYTVEILKQAPTVIFVINPLGNGLFEEKSKEELVFEICNIQSVSAAIQNILLAATNKGIGSLWICDTFFAYQELSDWLNLEGDLIAAIALGYQDENPKPRKRKPIEDIVEWRS